MFKKFYIYLIILSCFTSFIFSFHETTPSTYFYPIKNNNSISSYYGMRLLFGKNNFHNGIDIPATSGTPIYSIQNGIIQYIGFDNNGYGNYIIILHDNSYKSLYGHTSENYIVKIGDTIKRGQLISYVGKTILTNGKRNGCTTGPHLHFSVFTNEGNSIDPLKLSYEK